MEAELIRDSSGKASIQTVCKPVFWICALVTLLCLRQAMDQREEREMESKGLVRD
jgi:hypothetical protein